MRDKILFLTPRYPFPLIGGDRVKAFHLLRLLSERFDVTCVSFVEDGPLSQERLDAIRKFGVKVHAIPLSRTKAISRVGLTALSAKPLEIQYYSDARYFRTVRALHRQSHFDIAISFFMRTAEYALALPNIRRILVAEDARILTQQRAMSSSRFKPANIMYALERRKLFRYEPRIAGEFNITTYVSEEERDFMVRLNPRINAEIITNGVDLHEFPFADNQAGRHGLILCGKMDVLHNIRMAMRVGTEIFPALKKKFPGLQFYIVGKNPVPELRDLARRTNGIVITGEVPRVQEYIQSAAVFIHPLDSGSGIQNKLLEAMALGTAAVTTPLGVSGIRAHDGVHLRITETSSESIAACAELLSSPEQRGQLAANARLLIERDHTWENVGMRLFDIIKRIYETPLLRQTIVAPMEVAY